MIIWILTAILITLPKAVLPKGSAGTYINSELSSTCPSIIVSTVSDITEAYQMSTVFIIHDKQNEVCAENILNEVSVRAKVQQVTNEMFEGPLTAFLKQFLYDKGIPYLRNNLNFIVLCTPSCIQQVLEKSTDIDAALGKNTVLRHFSRWLLLSNQQDAVISGSNVILDNVANLLYQNDTLNLSTLLWSTKGREWNLVASATNLCPNTCVSTFPNSKLGLNGRNLRIVSLEWKPFTIKEKHVAYVSYSGVAKDVIDYLSTKFNFSYTLLEPPDKQWGSRDANNSWSGIIGMLQREEADMSLVPYAISEERAEVLEFTYPILMDYMCVIYKKTVDSRKTWTALIAGFTWGVYLTGAVVIVAITFLHRFVQKLSPLSVDFHHKKHKLRFGSNLMDIIAPALNQVSTSPPVAVSGRLLFGFWCLFCMVMTAVYRGNMMAFLTVDKFTVPFRSLDELANQDVYDVGSPPGSIITRRIQTSNQEVMQKLWSKIEETLSQSPATAKEGLEYQLKRLSGGKFAYMMAGVAADDMMRRSCDLVRLDENMLPATHVTFPFPLHSPLARLFYSEIITVIETGLYQRSYDSWLSRERACPHDLIGVGMSPLHIDEYYSAIAACAAGTTISCIVLLVEFYTSHATTIIV